MGRSPLSCCAVSPRGACEGPPTRPQLEPRSADQLAACKAYEEDVPEAAQAVVRRSRRTSTSSSRSPGAGRRQSSPKGSPKGQRTRGSLGGAQSGRRGSPPPDDPGGGGDAADAEVRKDNIVEGSTRSSLHASERQAKAENAASGADDTAGAQAAPPAADGGRGGRRGAKLEQAPAPVPGDAPLAGKQRTPPAAEKAPEAAPATGPAPRTAAQPGHAEQPARQPRPSLSVAEGLAAVAGLSAGGHAEPLTVLAPVAAGADEDGAPCVDASSFVRLRPLPYEPVPCDGEDNRQRSFLYKGELIKVPFLPLEQLDGGGGSSPKPGTQHGKRWAMVKSKLEHATKNADALKA